MSVLKKSAIALVACAIVARPAAAEEPAPPAPAPAAAPVDTLGASLALDLPVTIAAAGLWFGTEAAKGSLAPATCRFCNPNAVDDAVARAAAWPNRNLPATASDVGIFAVMPLFALGSVTLAANHDGKLSQAGWDMLLVAEAASLAQVVNQGTKFLVGRERPFVHWLSEADKGTTKQPSDNNLSFFSGHTTFSFALVTGAWSVSRMRGYSWANRILAIGLPMAAAVGYLRIAAGKHYLSDVLTGAVVGTGFGLMVPALHRWEAFENPPVDPPRLSFAPLPDGGGMAMATWVL